MKEQVIWTDNQAATTALVASTLVTVTGTTYKLVKECVMTKLDDSEPFPPWLLTGKGNRPYGSSAKGTRPANYILKDPPTSK